MAAMTRDQIVTELKSRGWSRFADADLQRYCDWGLRDVMREAKWADTVEVSTETGVTAATIPFSDIDSGNVRQIQRVYRKTANEEAWLAPLGDDDFFHNWLYADMTDSAQKGLPTRYYVYDNKIYLILAPNKAHDFDIHYVKRITAFNGNSVSGLPERFDEAIVPAAEAYCFRRAHEWDAMAVAQSEVRRIVLHELVEDNQAWSERQRQVVPHR